VRVELPGRAHRGCWACISFSKQNKMSGAGAAPPRAAHEPGAVGVAPVAPVCTSPALTQMCPLHSVWRGLRRSGGGGEARLRTAARARLACGRPRAPGRPSGLRRARLVRAARVTQLGARRGAGRAGQRAAGGGAVRCAAGGGRGERSRAGAAPAQPGVGARVPGARRAPPLGARACLPCAAVCAARHGAGAQAASAARCFERAACMRARTPAVARALAAPVALETSGAG